MRASDNGRKFLTVSIYFIELPRAEVIYSYSITQILRYVELIFKRDFSLVSSIIKIQYVIRENDTWLVIIFLIL